MAKRAWFILATLVALALSTPAGNGQGNTSKWVPHLIVATASGNTPTQAHSLTVVTSSDFNGTIDGKAVTGTAPGGAFTWSGTNEHGLAAMAYTVSAGTLYILYTADQ